MLNIFLTDLAAYNSGALVGKWINLPMEKLKLQTAINEVLCEGEIAVEGTNHEEYFITDWEWDNIDIKEVDEYENIFELNQDLMILESQEPGMLKAIKFILDEQFSYDIEDAILKAEDVIIHYNQTLEEFSYDLMQELYNADALPSIIANNIDYEGISNDLELDGTYFIVGDDVIEYIG